MKATEPAYLGDGVYATAQPESECVMITTGHHEESKADNVVYIDHAIWLNLVRYMRDAGVIEQ